MQGAWYGESLFPSPFSTLIWKSWVQTLWLAKTFFGTKLNCLHDWMISLLRLTFLSLFLLIQLARCFLPSALPSSSSIFKQVVYTYMNKCRLSYLSVLSKYSQAPIRVLSQLQCALWISKITTNSICNYFLSALPSLYMDLSVCWVGNN